MKCICGKDCLNFKKDDETEVLCQKCDAPEILAIARDAARKVIKELEEKEALDKLKA